ncbi:YebC/PmpR family DNA-binding transcriptional regulator [Candidatus Daviesbacteria bacterium]|nr:YebC/PmpR family DNA-binding transcriptional regulator [Candidatus Daviesbacteria bacterium]
MSGHSKWSTIKRAKGAADIKRGLTFTKVANAITIATKLGGSGDPDSNPRLRMAIDEARSVNMPKENIQRAIDRGLSKGGEQSLEEVFYEGFGPSKVAFIVEGVTDNKMRTLQSVKNLFDKNGGVLAQAGAVSYMFERKGEIKVKSKNEKVKSKEDEMLELIDLGAEDVESFDAVYPERSRGTQDFADAQEKQTYLIYVQSPELNTMGIKITQAGYRVESQGLVFKPTILVEVKDKESAEKVLEFAGKLEELDDVQKVYANFNISDEILNSNI